MFTLIPIALLVVLIVIVIIGLWMGFFKQDPIYEQTTAVEDLRDIARDDRDTDKARRVKEEALDDLVNYWENFLKLPEWWREDAEIVNAAIKGIFEARGYGDGESWPEYMDYLGQVVDHVPDKLIDTPEFISDTARLIFDDAFSNFLEILDASEKAIIQASIGEIGADLNGPELLCVLDDVLRERKVDDEFNLPARLMVACRRHRDCH